MITIKNLIGLGALFLAFCSLSVHAEKWRPVEAENAVLITLPHGKVVIELTPDFAPKHVAQFKQLIKQGYYQGTNFYRVIDGFVAQAGPSEDKKGKQFSAPVLAMESEWQFDKSWRFTQVQSPDLFASVTGFKGGFALGLDDKTNTAWLTHCPGVIAMARGNEADSADGHFYITIGQAPRYLDRIMTIFGRVIYGMEHIQAIRRTAVIEGQQAVDPAQFTELSNIQLMSDVPPAKRINLEIEDTESESFADKLNERRLRKHAFFYKKPPPVLDVCQVPVATRIANTKPAQQPK
ncbi:peptidylprolyl isomerase [Endozoicomonas sp. G2_1]|uniref:peptidylprolyl isomerase n=1 Tax=Endozoicomonas sp. G2_1 TaxID=2821091 RepID=UPI001ADA5CD1|nr:peptidylprolyl isomerase [Endozoicomonas sp. G2_1]MBO9490408.1 peptidylprolyl isomerase [Endozoicomonas sp. G2_1]